LFERPDNWDPDTLKGIKGVFVGSDYCIKLSQQLMRLIFENCLESKRQQLMLFKEHPGINYRVNRILDNSEQEQAQED